MSGNYYYSLRGQQQGPVTADQLAQKVQSGQLLPSDHFWQAGMPAWLPIGQFNKSAGNAPAEPAPPPVQSAASAAPIQPGPQLTQGQAGPPAEPAGPSFVERCLSEVKETAGVTVGHASSLVRLGQDQLQLNTARQQAVGAQANLGKRLYEMGLGDADQRARIHAAQERILSLRAAQTSTSSADTELRAEQVRQAEAQLDRGQCPPGLEAEFQAAQAARESLAAQQQAAGKSSEAVRPRGDRHMLRLAIGYGSIAMLLFMSLLAFGAVGSRFLPGKSGNLRPQPGDIVGPGPIDDGSGGGDNGGGGYNPPVEGPGQPVYVPPAGPQRCTFCFGTGQADCNACFGTGKKMCYQCNGMGRVQNFSNPNAPLFCANCNGTGKQNCGFCLYGKVQCNYCLGARAAVKVV